MFRFIIRIYRVFNLAHLTVTPALDQQRRYRGAYHPADHLQRAPIIAKVVQCVRLMDVHARPITEHRGKMPEYPGSNIPLARLFKLHRKRKPLIVLQRQVLKF